MCIQLYMRIIKQKNSAIYVYFIQENVSFCWCCIKHRIMARNTITLVKLGFLILCSVLIIKMLPGIIQFPTVGIKGHGSDFKVNPLNELVIFLVSLNVHTYVCVSTQSHYSVCGTGKSYTFLFLVYFLSIFIKI